VLREGLKCRTHRGSTAELKAGPIQAQLEPYAVGSGILTRWKITEPAFGCRDI